MQLKVTKLKLRITGGRGSNKEISLFIKLLKFHTDSPYVIMLMIYKFHKNLFF